MDNVQINTELPYEATNLLLIAHIIAGARRPELSPAPHLLCSLKNRLPNTTTPLGTLSRKASSPPASTEATGNHLTRAVRRRIPGANQKRPRTANTAG